MSLLHFLIGAACLRRLRPSAESSEALGLNYGFGINKTFSRPETLTWILPLWIKVMTPDLSGTLQTQRPGLIEMELQHIMGHPQT